MAQIYVIRHGQIVFGADKITEVGHQQARWLGEYFRELGVSFDHMVMGDLVRHRETSERIVEGLQQSIEPQIDADFNEYRLHGLMKGLYKQFPDELVKTDNPRKDHYYNMRRCLELWMTGDIESDGHDSWESFCRRVNTALDKILQSDAQRVLIVTSGGPVGVTLSKILRLDNIATRDIFLQVKNTGVNKLLYNGKQLTLDSFNEVSHLQQQGRSDAITY